jgi:uncharacterized protein (DUF2461 family)
VLAALAVSFGTMSVCRSTHRRPIRSRVVGVGLDRSGVDPAWWTPKMRALPSRRESDATPPTEYKAEVVELIRTTGKTVGQVA